MVRQQLHIYCFSANNAVNASTNITMSNVKNPPADQPIDRMTKPPSRLSAIPSHTQTSHFTLVLCAAQFRQAFERQ